MITSALPIARPHPRRFTTRATELLLAALVLLALTCSGIRGEERSSSTPERRDAQHPLSQELKTELARFFSASSEQQAVWHFPAAFDAMLHENESAARLTVWRAFRAAPIHAALKEDYEARQVRFESHVSPYTVREVGRRPEDGWPLFIAMHGGGGVPRHVNDSQWKVMQTYYRDQASVTGYLYLALRAPNDTWNGFYADYVYPLVANLVRQFLLFGDVDANKVFLMGYSHGGYGAFAIGPKMPDRFAAIHSSAAAPTDGESSPRNLRNTVFTFMIGEKDTMYGRLPRCQKFDEAIRALRGDRADIYPVTMEFKAGLGHGGLPDRDKIIELYPANRQPAPRELTWEMTDTVIKDFFWLHAPAPSKGGEIDAVCRDNHIMVTTTNVSAASVFLDERLVDFQRPVRLMVNGQGSIHTPRPSLLVLCQTLMQRGDPSLAFTARIELPLAREQPHPTNRWVKISPLTDAPPSPRLGYEGDCRWDSKQGVLIRYGGHNQGGGGEQHSEVWTFNPLTAQWTLKEPNTSPPGICCGQQNVFEPVQGRYLRFPAFSGSHGWQWWREIYLNDSSVWSYDPASNHWRNLRPLPAPQPRPLRAASWDSGHEVVVLFGGEGSREGTLIYDPYANAWSWPKPALEPQPRSGGNMVYDSARKLHILFGAQFSNDPHTWAYDLAANEWRDLKPSTLPPTDQNDAVLAYDSVSQTVLAIVKVTERENEKESHRLETWAYDTAANQWTRMNPEREPDPSGSRARNLVFAPELNLAILENRPHPPGGPAEQQVWTYRYGEGSPPAPIATARERPHPPIVEDVLVSVLTAREVEVSWSPSAGPVTGYIVERATVEVLTEDQLTRLKRNTEPLKEPSVGALKRIGPFTRLTPMPVTERTFIDTSVDLNALEPLAGEPIYERTFSPDQLDRNGKPYRFAVFAYRIRAVNASGLESGPSPAVFTIPSSPQWVFAKETGAMCDLKWAANPEKNIRGYRVYRMNGRWDKDPILRLTPDPIASPAHRDEEAGTSSRRYYIVAVDGLGQEGFPSAPVWFQREWKRFYEPFTGEWHQ
jgi:hypothetical protein